MTDRAISKYLLAFVMVLLLISSLCLWLWGGDGALDSWQRGACALLAAGGLVAVLWAK
jgi:F0F1-type ATP synthase assembly protein I